MPGMSRCVAVSCFIKVPAKHRQSLWGETVTWSLPVFAAALLGAASTVWRFGSRAYLAQEHLDTWAYRFKTQDQDKTQGSTQR